MIILTALLSIIRILPALIFFLLLLAGSANDRGIDISINGSRLIKFSGKECRILLLIGCAVAILAGWTYTHYPWLLK